MREAPARSTEDPLPFATPNAGRSTRTSISPSPTAAGAGAWALEGNRSLVADLVGKGAAQTGAWALPLTSVAPEDAFEAAHVGAGGIEFSPLSGLPNQPRAA
jgi:hypothetical protein